MLARTVRRSSSVFATKRWIAPAPRSNPSRNTYTASIIATRQNQIVPIALSLVRRQYDRIFAGRTIAWVRSEFDLAINQEQPQNRQHRVHPHEANQREPGVARGHARRDTAGGEPESDR